MRTASQKELKLNLASEDQLSRDRGKILKTGIGHFNTESGKKERIFRKQNCVWVKYMVIWRLEGQTFKSKGG